MTYERPCPRSLLPDTPQRAAKTTMLGLLAYREGRALFLLCERVCAALRAGRGRGACARRRRRRRGRRCSRGKGDPHMPLACRAARVRMRACRGGEAAEGAGTVRMAPRWRTVGGRWGALQASLTTARVSARARSLGPAALKHAVGRGRSHRKNVPG